jgi:heme/copper-type cytochrome/quinol oxidase subunit 4
VAAVVRQVNHLKQHLQAGPVVVLAVGQVVLKLVLLEHLDKDLKAAIMLQVHCMAVAVAVELVKLVLMELHLSLEMVVLVSLIHYV